MTRRLFLAGFLFSRVRFIKVGLPKNLNSFKMGKYMDLIQTDKKLKAAVRVLKDEFKPARLILFGSRANGTATEDSDYDFVMILSGKNENQLDTIRQARRILNGIGVSADVFVYSQSEFDDWKNEFSSVPEMAASTGYEIDLHE
jgi:predicted nucleotidyltransferase